MDAIYLYGGGQTRKKKTGCVIKDKKSPDFMCLSRWLDYRTAVNWPLRKIFKTMSMMKEHI